MKHPFRPHTLPFFTIGAGGLGLMLRIWLFAAIDDKGLLPIGHPADCALYILTAVTLGALYLATRKLRVRRTNAYLIHAGAYTAAGLGLLLTAARHFSGITTGLAYGSMLVTLLGALVLLCMAVLKAFRKPLPYLLPAILTAVLMVTAVAQCRHWGSEPQLQVYFFPLLASVFLILSAYHKTVFTARQTSIKPLAFFSQGTLFFCCLSLNTPQWPFYLGMLCWAAVQLSPCIPVKKEA